LKEREGRRDSTVGRGAKPRMKLKERDLTRRIELLHGIPFKRMKDKERFNKIEEGKKERS